MALNIQIFGTKKCQDTRKTERYFKERRITYHFIDLNIRGLSKGELRAVAQAVGGVEKLADANGKEAARLNLRYILHNVEEKLLEHPLLLKTPVVRNGAKATVGYCPEVWQTWQ